MKIKNDFNKTLFLKTGINRKDSSCWWKKKSHIILLRENWVAKPYLEKKKYNKAFAVKKKSVHIYIYIFKVVAYCIKCLH